MREWSKRIFARSKILQVMPYFTPSLYAICLSCVSKACISSCKENVLILNPDSVPTLDFSQSGCIFCEKCVLACFKVNGDHQGFDLTHQVVNMKAKIDIAECLAWKGSICYSCKDICPQRIEFLGMFYPEIKECNGCGLCLAKCPTEAIKIN